MSTLRKKGTELDRTTFDRYVEVCGFLGSQNALEDLLKLYGSYLDKGRRKAEFHSLNKQLVTALRSLEKAEQAIASLAEMQMPTLGMSLPELLEREHKALSRIPGFELPSDDLAFRSLQSQKRCLQTAELSERIASLRLLKKRLSGLSVKKDTESEAVRLLYRYLRWLEENTRHTFGSIPATIAALVNETFGCGPDGGVSAEAVRCSLKRAGIRIKRDRGRKRRSLSNDKSRSNSRRASRHDN